MATISVLIPDGESPFALHVIKCLSQAKEVQVHILSKKPDALCAYSHTIKSFHLLAEGQDLFERTAQICAQTHIDLLLPVDWNTICYIAERHGQFSKLVKVSPIKDIDTLLAVSDKGLLANFLRENQFPHPNSITNQTQFEEEIQDFPFPILVKPRISGNGAGIHKYSVREELIQHIQAQADFFDKFIIQEYVEGQDIDCSILGMEGNILAYTIQETYYVNSVAYQPAEAIQFVHHPQVLKITEELTNRLKWNGVAHIDMRIRASNGQVEIIEINPRFWGSVEGSLLAGVNFPRLTCLTGMGVFFDMPQYRETRYMSVFKALKRKLSRKPSVNLVKETNMVSCILDPLPYLVKLKQGN